MEKSRRVATMGGIVDGDGDGDGEGKGLNMQERVRGRWQGCGQC